MLRVLLLAVTLGVSLAGGQQADGQIAGRLTDKSGGALPGVRVTVTSGTESRETVTDPAGQFALRSLPMGTYRVATDLAGFTPASVDLVLGPSSPRAYLAWSLESGCIDEDLRIAYQPRQAAPLVDAILHVRVTSDDGPLLMSNRPGCVHSAPWREYSVRVLGTAPARGTVVAAQRQIFTLARERRLQVGHEYLVMVWRDGRVDEHLALPVVSGVVTSPKAGDLSGLSVIDALALLGTWAKEPGRANLEAD